MREHLFRQPITITALCALLLAACSDDSPSPSDTDADTTPSGRSYLLAARAEGYDITRARPFYATLDTLTLPPHGNAEPAAEAPAPPPDRPVEAIVLPVDLLGIPWSSFSRPDNRPTSLPATWLAEIEAYERLVQEAGVPVILAVSPLSENHDTLAPLASDGGAALLLNPTWKPSCYNPDTDANPTLYRDQFAGYVVWLVERFQPAAIVLGQRMNLYEANCGTAPFEAVKGFVAHAHTRLHATSTITAPPPTIASFDVEDLYGFPAKAGRCVSTAPKACLATRAPLLADLGVDWMGLESQPWRAFGDLSDIPRDWLSAVAAVQSIPTMVTSTGAPAIRIDADRAVCAPFVESDEAAQRAWLDQAIGFSAAQDAPFLVWRTLVDPIPTALATACPCSGDVPTCTHLAGLGNRKDDRRAALASGLAHHDGMARQTLGLWRSLLNR